METAIEVMLSADNSVKMRCKKGKAKKPDAASSDL
jgi:hypothetical protein